MTKVALETVGCRLNQYETEKIAGRMMAAGNAVTMKESYY
jgi:tRNA A37 methylthiotransferase MiaB